MLWLMYLWMLLLVCFVEVLFLGAVVDAIVVAIVDANVGAIVDDIVDVIIDVSVDVIVDAIVAVFLLRFCFLGVVSSVFVDA